MAVKQTMLTDLFWYLIAVLRFITFLISAILVFPAQFISAVLTRNTMLVPRYFCRLCCFILGIRVRISGMPSKTKTLYVSNHLSWADIIVLGGCIDGAFVAKKEVANWPIFGQLARLRSTVFIQRTAGGIKEGQQKIEEVFAKGHNMILFPEGTNGWTKVEILPFKSSYFSVTQDITIQPVAITVEAINGKDGRALTQDLFEIYGWSNVNVPPHLIFIQHFWSFLKTPSCVVRLTFCEPVVGDNRKILGQRAEAAVRNVVSKAYQAD